MSAASLTLSQISLLFQRLHSSRDWNQVKYHCQTLVLLLRNELADLELAKLLIALAFHVLRIIRSFLKNIGFEGFGSFPNRIRPKCTTMPWNIWPALVVLWGVCWMFYDAWDLTQYHNLLEDDLQFYIPYSTLDRAFLNGVDQNNFDFDTFVGSIYDVDPNFSFENVLPQELFDPGTTAMIPSWNNENSWLSTTSNRNPSPEPSISELSSCPTTMTTLSTQPSTLTPIPQKNPEGNYFCTLCTTDQTWKRLSGWKTHTAKHTRPFHCPIQGCKYASATKAVLERHVGKIHKGDVVLESSVSKAASSSEDDHVMRENVFRVSESATFEGASKRVFHVDDYGTDLKKRRLAHGCADSQCWENEILRTELEDVKRELDKVKEELARLK